MTSISSTGSSALYKDALLGIGDLSPSTWALWREYLPKAVRGATRVAGDLYYRNDMITKEEYTEARIPAILADEDKRKKFV
ncbi:hypothetical protein JCM1841_000122 [Sporobolomyces salmonicolor]